MIIDMARITGLGQYAVEILITMHNAVFSSTQNDKKGFVKEGFLFPLILNGSKVAIVLDIYNETRFINEHEMMSFSPKPANWISPKDIYQYTYFISTAKIIKLVTAMIEKGLRSKIKGQDAHNLLRLIQIFFYISCAHEIRHEAQQRNPSLILKSVKTLRPMLCDKSNDAESWKKIKNEWEETKKEILRSISPDKDLEKYLKQEEDAFVIGQFHIGGGWAVWWDEIIWNEEQKTSLRKILLD